MAASIKTDSISATDDVGRPCKILVHNVYKTHPSMDADEIRMSGENHE